MRTGCFIKRYINVEYYDVELVNSDFTWPDTADGWLFIMIKEIETDDVS